MVHKILKYRWMKIGLQNAIRAIHGAKGADMQNLIVATPVSTGAWTFLDKGTLVSGKEKNRLALLDRII
jgi:hypothetical protein